MVCFCHAGDLTETGSEELADHPQCSADGPSSSKLCALPALNAPTPGTNISRAESHDVVPWQESVTAWGPPGGWRGKRYVCKVVSGALVATGVAWPGLHALLHSIACV